MQQLSLVGIVLLWAYASRPCISLPWPHQVSDAALGEIGDQGSSPAKTEVSQKNYKRSAEVAEEVGCPPVLQFNALVNIALHSLIFYEQYKILD